MTGDRNVTLPTSYAQQRLWFLDQLMPDSAVYTLPSCLRLRGDLDVPALRAALDDLVARHEVLRTTFPAVAGEPMQRIAAQAVLPMAVADLSAQPREALAELLTACTEEPFDLARGPLVRVTLARLSTSDHVLILVLHHIISDAWSLEVLHRELATCYAARLRSEEPPLNPLPIQYADYAVWQRGQLTGALGDRELDWWRGQLAGAPDRLPLPTDHPAPPVADLVGATHAFALPDPTWRRVLALARTRRTTPFVVLLAVYAVLLQRLTGQSDLLIGTTVAGRDRAELEGLVGFFVNTVPIRITNTATCTAADCLDQVRRTTLEALARPELPFDRLVEAVRPERSATTSPLIQTVFSVEYVAADPTAFPGLAVEVVDPVSRYTKFDLSLTVEAGRAGQRGLLTYRRDLFEPGTIELLAERYLRLLDAFLTAPDTPLWQLPLLDPAELRQLTRQWGAPPATAAPAMLPALLAQAAADSPAAPAIDTGKEQVTFAELHRTAARLAHHLRRLGAGADDVVGVCLPRGVGLLGSLLAVLTADAAYLPLDPAHPPGRLATLIEQAGARLVLTTRELARSLPPGVEPVLVEELDLSGLPDTPPVSLGHPDQLAYVLSTSGSTGLPKPVGVTHRALANHAAAIRARYALTGTDRVLQFAGIGFDVAAEEIFATWLATGCVVPLADPSLAPAAFTRLLDDRRVTVANLPASYWRQWARQEAGPAGHLPDLRLMVVGSESVDIETVTRWREHTTVGLRNAYGVTEATITSTVDDVDGVGPTIPIGRPIAGVQTHVLDAELQPVPVGTVGELYLGGAGLARGYLRQAGMTAERFVPHPFATEPGSRLYRTGDRARWRPDGRLEFLDRGDEQLNIRGHRVEPAEVEAALRAHPGVADAVAAVRPAPDGERRLVAYVVPRGSAPVGSAQLRPFLAERLPAYLVPSAFVPVDSIPHTANHKVDRAALAALEPASRQRAAEPAPATGTERLLIGLWQELLGVGRVTTTDNFFDLGGYSLLMARLRARLQEELGREIPMIALYEHPTIAALAGHLSIVEERPPAEPPRPAAPAPSRLRRRRELAEKPKERPATVLEACIHTLVERQAAQRPHAVALDGDTARLTYRELNEQANRLARHLIEHGVEPDRPVAVLLERSAEFVVTALAILKAGAAFVPLDPAYPRNRTTQLLADSGADVVVTSGRFRESIAGPATVVLLDEVSGDRPTGDLDLPVAPDNLAYVMYTSGSTGVPKGVMVPHRAVVRLVRDADYARLGPSETLALISSIAFDASTLEIWGALLTGGRLVVGPAHAPSPAELGHLIRVHGVTTMWLTAGQFHLMVDESLADLRGLRQLLAGGDVLDPARVRRAVQELPGCQVVNGYGPTEGTTFTTCHRVPDSPSPTDPVPIGRPINGTTVRILDDHLQLVPVGVPGQLYAGGAGLARGYRGDAALTASRFVPDPYADQPGARLYATGDRARYRPGGVVEFLGRLDQQVKIRGHRVEPGEIEDALRRHPLIRDVAVVAHGAGAGERRLVAYPVLADSYADSVTGLRDWLRERLPAHLVPDLWVPLDELPLTANGKVDRRALPEPTLGLTTTEPAVATPRQASIAAIWTEVLEVAAVGVHDDFFELGGHSLLAAKVVARLRRDHGVEVPLSIVFDHPTVAELCAAIWSES
ncbi:amino acid adenylation domain-containing protein [Allocatelliglobosispora scoriae]|uniref:Amino acid adenylation domain-containing protein n=1 Tax=Allocatelliglobosispora scoriae TaxID=643052 RepID=A0A841BKG0_9ACTN|nr:non-ribosomal peptide synthetase [Allocatelliglobosispora scoriae]MBB5867838.1 amino acid adenylation domain-containing protein [Allocatelliglobosispora scoriae]